MKNLFGTLCFALCVWLAQPVLVAAPATSSWLNRIEGQVYDPNRKPVENAYVELLNDVDSVVGRTKTSSAGRFSFIGISAGRYNVKVLPLGTNMMEQTQEVQITDTTFTNNDTAYIDVYLRYDKHTRESGNATSREVVFAQEIPAAAKKLFESGVAELPKNYVKGVTKLEEAVKIFPDYFDALHRLGKEYVSHKQYEQGYPYLIRAIDINQRSYSSYYSLGYAFYQLKQYPAALEAARATTVLAPEAMEAQLLYGTLLRIAGSYPEAEKALLKANTLTNKTNGEVHWQLSLLYNRLNRTQDTINELEIFLKLVPDTPEKNKVQEMIAKLKATTENKK